jgi:hypothetical protein
MSFLTRGPVSWRVQRHFARGEGEDRYAPNEQDKMANAKCLLLLSLWSDLH